MPQREPAPPGLRLVQEFVNTVDIEEAREDFSSPNRLADWLAGRGLIPGGTAVAAAGLEQALTLRESLRSLLLANNGGPLYPVDLATLNQAAQRSLLRVRFQPDGGGRLEPEAAGLDAALGRILVAVFTAMAEGSWSRLKACRKHSCRWAFYDHSKNRSGTWCNMAVCGSRTKARTYRERKRSRQLGGQYLRVEPSSTPSAQ